MSDEFPPLKVLPNVTNISEQVRKHENQHAYGVAAYTVLKLLMYQLEETSALRPGDGRKIIDALLLAYQKTIDDATEGGDPAAESHRQVKSVLEGLLLE